LLRQAAYAYRLKAQDDLITIFGHSRPSDKIGPINVRKFSVKLPSRTDKVVAGSLLPPNSVTFYTDGSLFNTRAGARIYSESINIGESYALGTLAVNQSFNRKLQLQDKTICLCSDIKASLLAL
jgi:hypothetical protein